jgi:hypothetical protein
MALEGNMSQLFYLLRPAFNLAFAALFLIGALFFVFQSNGALTPVCAISAAMGAVPCVLEMIARPSIDAELISATDKSQVDAAYSRSSLTKYRVVPGAILGAIVLVVPNLYANQGLTNAIVVAGCSYWGVEYLFGVYRGLELQKKLRSALPSNPRMERTREP